MERDESPQSRVRVSSASGVEIAREFPTYKSARARMARTAVLA